MIKHSKPATAAAKAPGGKGFLIDHTKFTDKRPPRAMGASKSEGYPSHRKNP